MIKFTNMTITPNVHAVSGDMRALLSVSGQAAYDAASVGNFFTCSLADYTAVATGLTAVTKVGNTDVIFNTALGSSYTGTCASVLPQSNSTIPANNYIVGFACKMYTTPATTTVTPLISTTYKGTYTAISNSPVINGTARAYYLRKQPPITSVTSYVGHVAAGTGTTPTFDQATTSYTLAGFDCSAPYSGWTDRSGTMPNFQMLVTTTKPY